MAKSVNARQEAETPPPKAGPLAVIESGLPIAEVVHRLQELQQRYPTAQVRRGRANRWELWPVHPE